MYGNIFSRPSEIPTSPQTSPLWMEMFIKSKRLSFAEEMGVASKSTGKKLDVSSIKPQVGKLMEIKSEPIDVTAIQSQVDKVAINTSPTVFKEIVSNEEIAKVLRPDYIKPLSPNILEADRRAAVHQILERQEMNKVAKSSSGMHTNILG